MNELLEMACRLENGSAIYCAKRFEIREAKKEVDGWHLVVIEIGEKGANSEGN